MQTIIGKTVKGIIDRPLGSCHPQFPNMVYPINYGYVEGIIAGDGEEQDAYVLGTDKPIDKFEGKVIAESLAKSRGELVEDDLNSVSDEMIEEYLSIPFQPKFEGAKPRTVSEAERSHRINALYNYCEYLILEGLLSRNLITKPESKRKRGRVIKNSSEVKFTGNAKVKTTVDGKYSLIKEKYGKKPNEYHYCIRDEKSGLFFLDENGEKLVIDSYADARDYVKRLY